MGIDILGIDIMGVDILGIDIPAPTRFQFTVLLSNKIKCLVTIMVTLHSLKIMLLLKFFTAV